MKHTAGTAPIRIGIVGFGFVGARLFRELKRSRDVGLDIGFVWNRSPEKLADVPEQLRLDELGAFASRAPDLVVELAHPAITHEYGARILEVADYMPLSVSALVDAELEARLVDTAMTHGTRLLIPHGALIGVDNLLEGRQNWESVTITFEKHPDAIDFSESGYDGDGIRNRAVVFDGTAREIGRLYPRNVNTMVTCALATIGLDHCRARLIADPSLEMGVAEIDAVGHDGARLFSRKQQPMAGVSGTEMFDSLLGSVLRAARSYRALEFV